MKMENVIIITLLAVLVCIPLVEKFLDFRKKIKSESEFNEKNPALYKAEMDLKSLKFHNFQIQNPSVRYDPRWKKAYGDTLEITLKIIKDGKYLLNYLGERGGVENLASEISEKFGIPGLNPQPLDVTEFFCISIPVGYEIHDLKDRVTESFKWGELSTKIIGDFEKSSGVRVKSDIWV
jgi:hypothetical protein